MDKEDKQIGEEQLEKSDSLLKSTGKWMRYGLAGLGLLASISGLVLVILFYLAVSPSISVMREDTLVQIDNAINTVGSLDTSLSGVYDSLKSMPEFSEKLSLGLDGYAESTSKLADGIDGLAEKAATLGASADSFRSAASSLRSSSKNLSTQSSTLASITFSISESQHGIKKAKDDLAKAKSDLRKAKRDIEGVFDSLSNAILIACVLFALVFISLGAYSIALFL